MIRLTMLAAAGAAFTVAACDSGPPPPTKPIEVRAPEQDKLHQLDALNLAIALKRSIGELGYTCQRVDSAGFVGRYQNLDMWTASCNDGRQWAVFAGPDGTAQVRDCKDLAGTDLPKCVVSKAPKGSFEPEVANAS